MSDKILERVRLLLDRAEHANTPAPEAELCFQQANKLMTKHAIDEALVRANQTDAERRKPTRMKIKLGEGGIGEFWPILRTILTEVAAANRCRTVIYSTLDLEVFGFQEDVSWTEMLYTSIYMSFVGQLNPKWDEDKSYNENVYNFKVAGRKWHDINGEAMKHGHPDMRRMEQRYRWNHDSQSMELKLVPHKSLMKSGIVNAYKKHAKSIGDDNLVSTTSFEEYRKQYGEAFAARISHRLRDMVDSNMQEAQEVTGAEVALRDAMEDVNEYMFQQHPHLRPDTEEEIAARREAWRRQREQAAKAREEMLAGMTDRQRQQFLEKEEREQRREAQRNRRYWEQQDAKHNASAHRRGRKAADRVDLNRPNGGVGAKKKRKEVQ